MGIIFKYQKILELWNLFLCYLKFCTATAVPSNWASESKLIWWNILLEVFCCALCRWINYILPGLHTELNYFFQLRERGKLTGIPQWVWERGATYLETCCRFPLLHSTAALAPSPAAADHSTLLSARLQWKKKCACVGVNMSAY